MPLTLVDVLPEQVATHWLVATMHRGKFTAASLPLSVGLPNMSPIVFPLTRPPLGLLPFDPQPAAKPTAVTRLTRADSEKR